MIEIISQVRQTTGLMLYRPNMCFDIQTYRKNGGSYPRTYSCIVYCHHGKIIRLNNYRTECPQHLSIRENT